MKKRDSYELRNNVINMISGGKVDDKTLEQIAYGGPIETPDVLKTVDIMYDGKVRAHETTEKEVINFAARCEYFDQLIESIKLEREKYLKKKSVVEKNRKKGQKKEEPKDDEAIRLLKKSYNKK